MMDLVLDTDIGDDIDDALALLFALKCPELRVRAVTTVYGDVETRAMLVLRIMKEVGLGDIPVKPGASKPLLGAKPCRRPNQAVVLEGWERTLLERWKSGGAVELIASTVERCKGTPLLVSIGPLTNIALTLTLHPWIAEKAKLVMMGGCISRQVAEYNVKQDPEAARIVIESGIPLTMVGLDVTLKCVMSRKQVEALKSSPLPEIRLISRMIDAWAEAVKPGHLPILHDPLAVAVGFNPNLVGTTPMRVCVEVGGEYTRGFTVPVKGDPNVDVCLTVDRERFMNLFMDRVLDQSTGGR